MTHFIAPKRLHQKLTSVTIQDYSTWLVSHLLITMMLSLSDLRLNIGEASLLLREG